MSNRWDTSLIESVDIEPAANESSGDVRLEIGKRQDQIRTQSQDLVDIGRDEGADPRLFAASLRWAHRIAGDPDDPVLLAKQVERFDGLFGKTNDSLRRNTTPSGLIAGANGSAASHLWQTMSSSV
jgi:hypothetical protein